MPRKHTTTACLICREGKIKCDGARPTCDSCLKKGKICEYSLKDDKRKVSLRQAIEVLSKRVIELTELAINNDIVIPTLDADQQSMLDQTCDTLELPRIRVESLARQDKTLIHMQAPVFVPECTTVAPEQQQGPASTSAIHNGNDTNVSWDTDQATAFDLHGWTEFSETESWNVSPSDWTWAMLNDFSVLPSLGLDQSPATNSINRHEESESGSTSEDEVEKDIVPRLAARFGFLRLATDGRLRYYGSASNHHFLNGFRYSNTSTDIEEAERATHLALENAQLDIEAPGYLRDHLIELFFTWHNTTHRSVDKTMFDIARAQDLDGRGSYCSNSLLSAICALGAAFEGRYHQSFVTFPKSLADYFADRSKILLEFEFDSPCVATVQALLLLSSHEAAAGKDGRMWLYSGMAMRLAFDLGLHVDSEPYVKQGLLTISESEARRSTFWSCVVVNQLWSFSLGRPFRVDSEEVTVAKPSCTLQTNLDARTNLFGTVIPLTDGTAHQNAATTSLVAAHWVELCEELAPLIRILYGCVTISKASLQALSAQTVGRLQRWHGEIPADLKLQSDKDPLPNVLVLHMGYHNFCILIHRPWTSKGSQPHGGIGPGHHHARGVCRTSASEIANLLRIYESHYGFRKMNVYVVNIIVSAALILIFGLIAEEILGDQHDQESKLNVVRDLNTCFRALDELGRSFHCAKLNHEHLLAIQKHWSQRRRDARSSAKRRTELQKATTDRSRKRPRSLKTPG